MLEKIRLTINANKSMLFSGIDSYFHCINKSHFNNYPYNVSYQYNSRGFRDEEWPSDSLLSECIWCIGDSFTVGLGSPLEHIWPNVLQKESGKRTINVSMDGASNSWISRMSSQILKEVSPKNMVVMFSYFSRRELPERVPDLQRRLRFIKYETFEDDMVNFQTCLRTIENYKKNTNIIYFAVPKCVANNKKSFLNFPVSNFLGEVQMLDYARDYHHFDILTSQNLVNKIIPLLAN